MDVYVCVGSSCAGSSCVVFETRYYFCLKISFGFSWIVFVDASRRIHYANCGSTVISSFSVGNNAHRYFHYTDNFLYNHHRYHYYSSCAFSCLLSDSCCCCCRCRFCSFCCLLSSTVLPLVHHRDSKERKERERIQ